MTSNMSVYNCISTDWRKRSYLGGEICAPQAHKGAGTRHPGWAIINRIHPWPDGKMSPWWKYSEDRCEDIQYFLEYSLIFANPNFVHLLYETKGPHKTKIENAIGNANV